MFSVEAQLRIFNFLFNILDDDKNDRGTAILLSQYYKDFMDKGTDSATCKRYLENTKEIFELTLDCMKDDSVYILDLTERI